jgi:murein DD-endopeptidase MepM/ murein hydrolase activator NlpD
MPSGSSKHTDTDGLRPLGTVRARFRGSPLRIPLGTASSIAECLLAASLLAMVTTGLGADSSDLASVTESTRQTSAIVTARRAAPAHGYLVAEPGYFRPVFVAGKTFPVARSNFFQLMEFPNSWHDPRLRLVNGKWLLVGVHEGIDITAERGTPVLSMSPGVVERVGWTFYSGTRVGVRGTDGRYYFYGHLAAVAPGIAPGVPVPAGAYLGRVGNTGYGTEPGHRDEFAPHLHFGVQLANSGPWVNPYPLLVALYSATVRADEKARSAIDRLAVSGKQRAWEHAVDRWYLRLPPW